MESRTVKEIKQKISDELFVTLVELPSAFEMRDYVKQKIVPHIIWKNWHGCRVVREGKNRYIYHCVDIDCEVKF